MTGREPAAELLIVGEAELRGCLSMAEAVAAVEAGFRALAGGHATLPPPIGMELADTGGEIHVKGAYLGGESTFVFKIASAFYGNAALGLPTAGGLMLACDARTGAPRALLLDNSYLTDLRTGAAGALAARYLAPAAPRAIAVLGAGVQARMQLRGLACERPLAPLRIWSRDGERARRCARELAAELGVAARACATIAEAVADADVIVTATPSRTPLLHVDQIRPGVHVTAVGSDGPAKQELDPQVLARADKVVVDRLEQCLRLGELHHAVAAGLMRPEAVHAELGDLVVGRRAGRQRRDEITVADLTGVGVQDAAIAAAALRAAAARGLGRLVQL